jgi:GT2 family glycosyltransferase
VEEKFFTKLSDFLAATPQASIAGFRLVDANGERQPSCWKKPTLGRTVLEMFLPYEVSIHMITENPIHTSEVDMVSGACMAIKRDLFDRLKGLDSQFFMYYEDADFCYRTRDAGFHIYCLPTISVYHRISGSGGIPETLTVQFYRSKILFFKKHYSRMYAFCVRAIVTMGILVRVPAYFIAGGILFNKKLLGLGRLYVKVASRSDY